MPTAIWFLGGLTVVLGFIVAVTSIFVSARGEKVAQGANQKIKYGNLEVTTNQLGLLVIAGLAAMVLPVVGFLYLLKTTSPELQKCEATANQLEHQVETLNREVHRHEQEATRGEVDVTARVMATGDRPARGLEGQVVRLETGGKKVVCERQRLTNGEFTCRMQVPDLRSRFIFYALKAGSTDPVKQQLFSPLEQNLTISVDEEP